MSLAGRRSAVILDAKCHCSAERGPNGRQQDELKDGHGEPRKTNWDVEYSRMKKLKNNPFEFQILFPNGK